MFGWLRKRTAQQHAEPARAESAALHNTAAAADAPVTVPQGIFTTPGGSEGHGAHTAQVPQPGTSAPPQTTVNDAPAAAPLAVPDPDAGQPRVEAPHPDTILPEVAPGPTTAKQLEPVPHTEMSPTLSHLIPAPSARPAMPLSAHPNFVGLGLTPTPDAAQRILEPIAALSPEAQEALYQLFSDLFGPTGRYRLEWRTDRNPGDDAVFADIMTADLVRRVQNTIADLAELERPSPLRALEPPRDDTPGLRAVG